MCNLISKLILLSILFVSTHSLSLQGVLIDQQGNSLRIEWDQSRTIRLRLSYPNDTEDDVIDVSLHIQCERWWVCAVNNGDAIDVNLSRGEEKELNISISSLYGYIGRSNLIVQAVGVGTNVSIESNITDYEVGKSRKSNDKVTTTGSSRAHTALSHA